MKKALIVIAVLIVGCGGYLYYDWHTKTNKRAAEPSVPQYSWTDAQGVRHFTDRPPPKGATNIRETRGYKYVLEWGSKIKKWNRQGRNFRLRCFRALCSPPGHKKTKMLAPTELPWI